MRFSLSLMAMFVVVPLGSCGGIAIDTGGSAATGGAGAFPGHVGGSGGETTDPIPGYGGAAGAPGGWAGSAGIPGDVPTGGWGGAPGNGCGAGDPDYCVYSMPNASCQECMECLCLETCNDILEVPDAFDWFLCAVDCASNACIGACLAEYPMVAEKDDIFWQCMGTGCYEKCGFPPPDACLLAFNTGPMEDCNACFQDKCRSACFDLQTNPEFSTHNECLHQCGNQACVAICNANFPEAAAASAAFYSCLAAECPIVCAAVIPKPVE